MPDKESTLRCKLIYTKPNVSLYESLMIVRALKHNSLNWILMTLIAILWLRVKFEIFKNPLQKTYRILTAIRTLRTGFKWVLETEMLHRLTLRQVSNQNKRRFFEQSQSTTKNTLLVWKRKKVMPRRKIPNWLTIFYRN